MDLKKLALTLLTRKMILLKKLIDNITNSENLLFAQSILGTYGG